MELALFGMAVAAIYGLGAGLCFATAVKLGVGTTKRYDDIDTAGAIGYSSIWPVILPALIAIRVFGKVDEVLVERAEFKTREPKFKELPPPGELEKLVREVVAEMKSTEGVNTWSTNG
jgi:hypothetical protein